MVIALPNENAETRAIPVGICLAEIAEIKMANALGHGINPVKNPIVNNWARDDDITCS